MKVKIRRWLIIWTALIICFFSLPIRTKAAEKQQIRVKVNDSFYAAMEKSGEKWYLIPEKEQETDPFQGNVLYLKVPSGKELKTGYYFFNKKGCLDSRKIFHEVDTTVGSRRLKGRYYFGEENGRLYVNKGGWNVINNRKYFLSNMGAMYRNRWVRGYYLKSNGQIAKNMETPDGYYVDCDGHKCSKEEMKLSNLKKSLNSMIGRYSGTWSVYVKDLNAGDILSINDKAMKPASVIKLFVMASTYDMIQKGKIKKDSYVNSLLKDMITVSDNESYNALVRKHSASGSFIQGCKVVNQYLKKIGCTNTECHSTLHPSGTSFTWDGQSNKASVKDAGMLLEKIYTGKCVSARYSKEMLNLLLNQTRRWKIPAGVPSGIKVANKTGENDQCQNDVAIVYGKKTTYIVCIFAETGEYSGTNGIKALSSKIYNYLN